MRFSDEAEARLMDLTRRVAAEEILPRFRQLPKDEIESKTDQDDLVTIADKRSEMRLTEGIKSILPEADVVALAVPLTPETKHMINETAIKAMKPGSYLINIARGKVVDTDAMLAGLDSGKIAGACLDVTDPEPLTKGHRLWKMPNVIITPHVAGRSAVTTERRAALLQENLRRFAKGEPLMNVVDKKLGY